MEEVSPQPMLALVSVLLSFSGASLLDDGAELSTMFTRCELPSKERASPVSKGLALYAISIQV